MGASDRLVRNEAVTLRGNVFGHNYKDETEYDLTQGAFTSNGGGSSDLCAMLGINPATGAAVTPTPGAINSLRVMQPHYGEVVECYLDYIQIRSATEAGGSTVEKGGLGMYIAIGDFTDNLFTTPRTSYTLTEIQDSWEMISGVRTPINMTSGGDDWRLIGRRINLLPEIKKADNPLFVEDGFNLILAFGNTEGTMLFAPQGSGAGSNFAFEFLRIAMAITGIK